MPRVAVTTAVDRAPIVARALHRHGLKPVLLPCIEVVPAPEETLAAARSAAGIADWVLLTSPRAVCITWPSGLMPDVPVAAVGAATAEEAARAGGRVELVGEAGAVAMVEELAPMVKESVLAFPHARGARRSTFAGLEEAGARLVATAVYETVPVRPDDEPVDAVIFGSPSAVAGWAMSRTMDEAVLAVIGETTRRALAELGQRADVAPETPGIEQLVAALDDYLKVRRTA